LANIISMFIPSLSRETPVDIVIAPSGSKHSMRIVIRRVEIVAIFGLSLFMCFGVGNIIGNSMGTAQGLRQVEDLRAELQRVQAYEAELVSRAIAFEATIREAGEFDFNYLEHDELLHGISGSPLHDVGGGEFSVAPIISMYPEHEAPQQTTVLEYIDAQTDLLRKVPISLPIKGGRISSGYGNRISPFSRRRHMHHGMDFAVDRSTPVLSTADGKVVYSGYKGGYGKVVIIEHGNRTETLYGHLSKTLVKPGDVVCRGEQVGLVGSTGNSTGPHLHYEVRINGNTQDPNTLLQLGAFLKFLT
jgi:murein DD-endopeptidase MepM/ murein hydrolase activator NlpD